MGNKNTQCAELFSGKPDAPDDTPEPVKDAEVIASPSKQAMKPATTNSDEPAAAAQPQMAPRKPSTPGSLKRMEKREQRRAVTASLPENWRLLEERQRAIIRRLAECERAAGYVGTNRVKKQEWYDAARLPGLGGKNYLKGGKRGKHWIKGIEGGGRYGKDAASSSGGGGATKTTTAEPWWSAATKPSAPATSPDRRAGTPARATRTSCGTPCRGSPRRCAR